MSRPIGLTLLFLLVKTPTDNFQYQSKFIDTYNITLWDQRQNVQISNNLLHCDPNSNKGHNVTNLVLMLFETGIPGDNHQPSVSLWLFDIILYQVHSAMDRIQAHKTLDYHIT